MRVAVVRGGEKFAWPLSAISLVFSALALPLTYAVVPSFCGPTATVLDVGATIGVVSLAAVLAVAGILTSLLSVYTVGNGRARRSLALSVVSMGLATTFIVFGLALRACPT